jgi:16S rRNA G527 N7-methylase RsmG
MKELFDKYNIELTKDEELSFEKFLNIFMDKNSKINLSSIRDEK